jgi:hypothetical protein
MIYVLNIGYESYVFANSRGLQTVMDAMAKARRLKHHYYQGCEKEHPERLELSDDNVEVSMNVVNGVSFVSGKTKREVIEPEVMPRERPGRTPAALALKAAYDLPIPKEWGRVTSGRRAMLGEGK